MPNQHDYFGGQQKHPGDHHLLFIFIIPAGDTCNKQKMSKIRGHNGGGVMGAQACLAAFLAGDEAGLPREVRTTYSREPTILSKDRAGLKFTMPEG